MYQTIQLSSCVSVQGDLVEALPNGDAIISDGRTTYRGRTIAPVASVTAVPAQPSPVIRRNER